MMAAVTMMSSFCHKLASSVQESVQAERDISDIEQTKMRIYIVQRCKRAAAALYGDSSAEQVLQITSICAHKL